ncbi:TPA: GtrA family protein [Candidatus Galligastranaerophilus intestinigallinarum]|nr:GtrA family protein [Candidatus Galligastranaerophilus intestinigallinarum]
MDKTKKEISRFILSGILAVLTDTFVYYILSHFIDLSLAKGISFLTGTITAYLMNKYYTFEQKRKSIKEVVKFLLLYLVSLTANVGVNKTCLLILPSAFSYISFLNNFQAVKLFSFLCATGTSTIINFSGQKFWVFKGK